MEGGGEGGEGGGERRGRDRDGVREGMVGREEKVEEEEGWMEARLG